MGNSCNCGEYSNVATGGINVFLGSSLSGSHWGNLLWGQLCLLVLGLLVIGERNCSQVVCVAKAKRKIEIAIL